MFLVRTGAPSSVRSFLVVMPFAPFVAFSLFFSFFLILIDVVGCKEFPSMKSDTVSAPQTRRLWPMAGQASVPKEEQTLYLAKRKETSEAY